VAVREKCRHPLGDAFGMNRRDCLRCASAQMRGVHTPTWTDIDEGMKRIGQARFWADQR
jgi:hypothetical protein